MHILEFLAPTIGSSDRRTLPSGSSGRNPHPLLCEGLLHTSVSAGLPRDVSNLINQLICKYILIYSWQISLGVKLSDSKPYAVHKSRTSLKYHRLPQCKNDYAYAGPHKCLSPNEKMSWHFCPPWLGCICFGAALLNTIVRAEGW